MKVLVTGATGFIGNYVVNELLRKNHQVIATSKNIKKAKKQEWYSSVKYIPYDLNDNKKKLFNFFQKPEAAIHLAWQGLPNYKDMIHLKQNFINNSRFLKNLLNGGLKNLTVTGTCLEYGIQSGCLPETALTQPITFYGMAKDQLRKFLEQLQQQLHFSFKWVRLFYLYGKGQSEKSLLSQLEIAIRQKKKKFEMSGGKQLRDYLPVEKVAEYIVAIALQDKIRGIINCCSGKPVTIRKLVENYLSEKNKSIELNLGFYPYTTYEPMAFWGDNKKLKQILKVKIYESKN